MPARARRPHPCGCALPLQAAVKLLEHCDAYIDAGSHLSDTRPSQRDTDCANLSLLLRSLLTLLQVRRPASASLG